MRMQQTVLVQTLVVRGGQVLLGRWRAGSGPFEGRLSGLLGRAGGPPGEALPTPESVAAGVCTELLGPGVQVDPRRLRRRAFFQFEERDPLDGAAKSLGTRYSEHQFLLRLRPGEAFEPAATETFAPAGWFGPEDIPFDRMPEDDQLWYEQVLYKERRLRGSFAFEGTRLAEHHLEEVAPAEGLCGLESACIAAKGPLLLHNGACTKSQALRTVLEARGRPFMERRYLEDPLTLSELETLLARLRAGAAGRGISDVPAAALCRDGDLSGQGEDAILEAVAMQPELLQRPMLVLGRRAALGRPAPEDALWLLPK